MDNLEASVIILKNLSSDWKTHSVKHTSLDPVRQSLKALKDKVTPPFVLLSTFLTILTCYMV